MRKPIDNLLGLPSGVTDRVEARHREAAQHFHSPSDAGEVERWVEDFGRANNYTPGTCDLNRGDCDMMSNVFADWFEDQTGAPLDLYAGAGFIPPLGQDANDLWIMLSGDEAHTRGEKPLQHVVVRWGDWIIDLTGRQFGSKYKAPVYPFSEFKQRWAEVRKTKRANRQLNNIRRMMLQNSSPSGVAGRVAARHREAGLLKAPPEMVKEITDWVQTNTARWVATTDMVYVSDKVRAMARKDGGSQKPETKTTATLDLKGWPYLKDMAKVKDQVVANLEKWLKEEVQRREEDLERIHRTFAFVDKMRDDPIVARGIEDPEDPYGPHEEYIKKLLPDASRLDIMDAFFALHDNRKVSLRNKAKAVTDQKWDVPPFLRIVLNLPLGTRTTLSGLKKMLKEVKVESPELIAEGRLGSRGFSSIGVELDFTQSDKRSYGRWSPKSKDMGFNPTGALDGIRVPIEDAPRWVRAQFFRLPEGSPVEVLGLDSPASYKKLMRKMVRAVLHEMTHVSQSMIDYLRYLPEGSGGMPSRSIRDQTFDTRGAPRPQNPLLSRPPPKSYLLRDVEFYTWLQDEVGEFLYENNRNNTPLESWDKARQEWVGARGKPSSEFFQALKDEEPAKWKKAVGEFWKATEHPSRVASMYREAALRDWLKWMVQPIEVLNKKYRDLVYGPLDDLVDEIFRDIAPQLVKAVGEQEIDEDVEEYLAGAQEGRFEAIRGWFADAEPNQSDDYYAGYDWGFANAKDWDGKDLPAAVKRKVVQEQIKEFRGEVSEQVMIAAMESAWSSVNPREIFKTVMRAVKQHGWKVGLIYAVGEIIENVVLPAALSVITGTPIPPGSFAWLPLNDIVFAAVVKRLGRNSAVDDYEEDGYLDWYEGQFGAVRLASVDRVVSRHKEAGLLAPPPAMTEAARYFFVARWGDGVLKEATKKTRSQTARLRSIQKNLQEQKASIAQAKKAMDAGKPFDLIIYHQPKTEASQSIRKRKVRYTPSQSEPNWRGEVETQWEADKPFQVHYSSFDQPNLDDLENEYEVGVQFLEMRAEEVEQTLKSLDTFKKSVRAEVAKRKNHANLLSAPNRDLTECEMDLSGWTLWEKRIPDAAQREATEQALDARKTLKMHYEPKDTGEADGGFSAYWSPSKWLVGFAGLSGYWSVESLMGRHGEVNTSAMKRSLVALDRVVDHEMRHYAQSLLKELLDLPEIAGHPGLSDPAYANIHGTPAGEEWAKWDPEQGKWVDQRIPHELRDVEFEARLGDEVERFERGLKRVDETLERDASRGNRGPSYAAETLKDYFDVFTGRSQKRLDVWGANPSAWFAYLRKNDSKRYQAAVAKFTAEMDRRGFMKRLKTKSRIPVPVPNHKAWGQSISRMMPWREGYEAEKKALQDYARFIDGLSIDQLRRHRSLVRDTGDKEYWVTPRWQDHLKKPLSKEEIEARRTEGARIEHPDIRRKGKSARRVAKRHAFVSNPVVALKNYLTQEDWEKGAEVAQDNEGHFMQWLEENPHLVEDVPALQEVMEDGYFDDAWDLPQEALKEYFGEVGHALSDQSWSPSWVHMAYEKVMKNQWMIHFTDDAYGVACNGFKYGMDDLTRLGLTTHYNEAAKPGGYNFAYDLNDWERFARGRWGFKYGKEAVLFKASGIKVWHHGDNEYQVIFVGDTAKDIVPLTEDGYYGGWWANGIGKGGREEQDSEQGDGSFDSLAEAVDWVVANFNQYKKFLTC